MVQIPAPGTLVIVWEMSAPIGSGYLTLEGANYPAFRARVEARGDRYEAKLEGLPSGWSCNYTIYNDRKILGMTQIAGPIETKTALPRGRPFRFVAFGDSGNASNTQSDLAVRIADTKPDLVIHVGDLVYPAGKRETYNTHFFEPNKEMIRHAPFMPSMGNHDAATQKGAPLLDVFVCPQNGPPGIEPERCYWFDYGDARFVAIDTNLVDFAGALTADQMKNVIAPWMRQVFKESDARWKFVFFHHPFYTGSEHGAEGAQYVKDAYLSVFDDSNVDVVFCGHNHLYERTSPMRADQVVAEGKGPVYITTGAGGSTRYPEHLPSPAYIKIYNDQVFSFTQVDLSTDRFELKQIDENGRIIDEYVISKAGSSSVASR